MCRSIVLLVAFCLLPSCVSTASFRFGTTTFAPRDVAHPVVLFDTLEDVRTNFVKVARVVAEGSSEANWPAIVAALKQEARRVGADAMVLRRSDKFVHSVDEDCVSYHRIITALGIRFVDGD